MKIKLCLAMIVIVVLLVATVPVYGAGINTVVARAKQSTWLVADNTNFAGIGVDFTKRRSPSRTQVFRLKTRDKYDALVNEPDPILLIKGKLAKTYNFCYSTWEPQDNRDYRFQGVYLEYMDKETNTLYITAYTNIGTCQ